MSAYLLDTNVWIALLKNDFQIVERVRRVGVSALHLCTPVWSGLWFGACNGQRVAENQARLRELVSHVFSDAEAICAFTLRAREEGVRTVLTCVEHSHHFAVIRPAPDLWLQGYAVDERCRHHHRRG